MDKSVKLSYCNDSVWTKNSTNISVFSAIGERTYFRRNYDFFLQKITKNCKRKENKR